MNEPGHLFVYGTLRRGYDHPMQALLERLAHYHAPGWCAGRLYRVSHYPGLVPGSATGRVRGDIYRIDAATGLLPRLDAYEACGADDPLPHDYARRVLPVVTDTGETVSAWVYVWLPDPAPLVPIPSGDFLAS